MNVLFDGNALQSQAHIRRIGDQAPGVRLKSLKQALQEKLSYDVDFSAVGKNLEGSDLDRKDLLVIPTRVPDHPKIRRSDLFYHNPFSETETRRIQEFVQNGNGLVLFTNHGPLTRSAVDFTAEDKKLATIFGIQILSDAVFKGAGEGVFTNQEYHSHPITSGGSQNHSVERIVVNNCANLRRTKKGVMPVVDMSGDKTGNFCLAAEKDQGRAVFVADSGFLGSEESDQPGPGMFHRADNEQFILNTFRWGAGEIG